MNKTKTYNGLYKTLLKRDKSHYTTGLFGLEEGKKTPFKEHFKTYPTHRLYNLHFYRTDRKLRNYEKSFLRDYCYHLLTQNHDFSKSFRKQVQEFFPSVKERSVTKDGQTFFTYELQLKEPLKLKQQDFEYQLRSSRSHYKYYNVCGKGMGLSMGSTKLRTKEDSNYFDKWKTQSTTYHLEKELKDELKMVA